MARIDGGIDDNSEAARSDGIGSIKPMLKPKEEVAEVAAEAKKSLKEIVAENLQTENDTTAAQPTQPTQPTQPVVKTPRLNKETSAMLIGRMDALQNVMLATAGAISGLEDSLADVKGAVEGLKKEDEPKEVTNPLELFKSGVHRVTFVLNGMEFTVKCLNLSREEETHCIVLAFPTDGDSFFVPPMQSELRMKYDGVSVGGRLFYFGMNFSLPELGLRFLGFLFDEREEVAESSEQ